MMILAEKQLPYLAEISEKMETFKYYHLEVGEGVNNLGFQNWNQLVNNMIAWLEGREMLHEV